jgi:uncharacterized protein
MPTHTLTLKALRSILGAATPAPYVLENTEVIATPASRLDRTYEIYVSLPPEYAKTTKRYPVVYVTDAPYAFPLIRAIAARVDRHGVGLESFILVGLSYAKGESGATSRNRDYTPTDRARDRKAPEAIYGQSATYLDFLERDVLPLVDSRYRTEPKRRIFVGHSYGSLLGLQALLERPNIFSHYILGSPSFWFDQEQPFVALKHHTQTSRNLVGKVRFYVGGLEQPTRTRPDEVNMVALTNRYVAELRAALARTGCKGDRPGRGGSRHCVSTTGHSGPDLGIAEARLKMQVIITMIRLNPSIEACPDKPSHASHLKR